MVKKLEIGRSALVKDRMRSLSDTIVRPYLVGSNPTLRDVVTDDPAYRINPDGTVILEMVIRDPVIQAEVKAEQELDKLEASWTKVRSEMLELIVTHGMRLQIQKYRQSVLGAGRNDAEAVESRTVLNWNIRLLTTLYGVFNENPMISSQRGLKVFQHDCIIGIATQEIKDLLRATTCVPISACCMHLERVRWRMAGVFDMYESLLDWLFVPPHAGYPNAPSGRILQLIDEMGQFEGVCRKAFTKVPHNLRLAYPCNVPRIDESLHAEYLSRISDLLKRKCTNVIFAHLANLNTALVKGMLIDCASTARAIESLSKAELYVAKQKAARKLKYTKGETGA